MIYYVSKSTMELAPEVLPPADLTTLVMDPASTTGPFPFEKNWQLMHLFLENVAGPLVALMDVEIEIYAYASKADTPMLIASFVVNTDSGKCDVPMPIFALSAAYLYVRQASYTNPVNPAGGLVPNPAVNFVLACSGQDSH
jgi:hypothetical protein